MNTDEFQKGVYKRLGYLANLIEIQNNMIGYLLVEKLSDIKERIFLLNSLGLKAKVIAVILQEDELLVADVLSQKYS